MYVCMYVVCMHALWLVGWLVGFKSCQPLLSYLMLKSFGNNYVSSINNSYLIQIIYNSLYSI